MDSKGSEFTFISPLNSEVVMDTMVFYSFNTEIVMKDMEKNQMQTPVMMNH